MKPTQQHNLSSVSQHIQQKIRKKSPIVLDRVIPEFCGGNLEYLPVDSVTFGHGRIRIPLRRDLAQAGTRGYERWSG